MIIETPKQIHALSHPMRQRILSILYQKEMTNKQIASSLNEVPSKVYFHVKELLDAGLIKLTKEKQNHSIIEKFYTTSAHSFRLSPEIELAKTDEHVLFESTLREASRNLFDSLDEHNGKIPDAKISHQVVPLTVHDIQKINERISEIDEIIRSAFLQNSSHAGESKQSLYSISYFFHPVASSNGENSDDQ